MNRRSSRSFRIFLRTLLAGAVLTSAAAFASPSSPLGASGGEAFSSPSGRFNATIPAEFERITVADPRVPLALRIKNGGFPTANVIVFPGVFDAGVETPAVRGERIRDDYRAVGLLDAELLSAEGTNLGGSAATEAVLRYTVSAVETTAKVTEATLADRRITVTWLVPTAQASAAEPLRRALLDSFQIEGAANLPEAAGLPRDFGPLYAETDMRRFPVEPWNTASNVVFAALLVVFGRRTRFDRKRYPFLVPALGVLAVGCIGGTMYHATRSHNVWLLLDFAPILLLTGAASLYFWFAVVQRRAWGVAACVALIVSGRAARVFFDLPRNLGITVSYLGAAAAILIPAAIHAAGEGRPHRRYIGYAAVLFAAALTCRWLDNGPGLAPLPMGTHFLWHIFGGLSVGALLAYVASVEEGRAAAANAAGEKVTSPAGA